MVRSRKGETQESMAVPTSPSGRNAHEAVSSRVRIGDASVFVQDDGFKAASDSCRKRARFRPAPCCVPAIRCHFLQCLPQVVEIATALQAWQVGEIACANAFHACTQRGHGPQNAPVRQGQQAQRTSNTAIASTTACVWSWFQVSAATGAGRNQSTARPGAWRALRQTAGPW